MTSARRMLSAKWRGRLRSPALAPQGGRLSNPRRRVSVRLAAHIASGFKSRQEDLCKGLTSCRQRQTGSREGTVEGPSQTLARNESERDSAAPAGGRGGRGEARPRKRARGWRWGGGDRGGRALGRAEIAQARPR